MSNVENKKKRLRDPTKDEADMLRVKLARLANLTQKNKHLRVEKMKIGKEVAPLKSEINTTVREMGDPPIKCGECRVSRVNARQHRKPTLTMTWQAIKNILGDAALAKIKEEVERIRQKRKEEASKTGSLMLVPTEELRKKRSDTGIKKGPRNKEGNVKNASSPLLEKPKFIPRKSSKNS